MKHLLRLMIVLAFFSLGCQNQNTDKGNVEKGDKNGITEEIYE